MLVQNCTRLLTIVVILRRNFPLERSPKGPQKCTIIDDCVQIAESGLKPPFESPHLDFAELNSLQKKQPVDYSYSVLSVKSPAFILSKNSGVPLAIKSAEIV